LKGFDKLNLNGGWYNKGPDQ